MSREVSGGSLEPSSRYQSSRRLVSWVALILGVLIGVGGGLFYTWNVNPVEEFNTEPWQLNNTDRDQYVVAIALSYGHTGDLNRAVERLLSLRPQSDPIQSMADSACKLATTGYVDSGSGLRAIRSMMRFYQLQGRTGCADTLIPMTDGEPTPVVSIDVPTPTLVPPASKTPTPENISGATPTTTRVFVPTSLPQRDFVLADVRTFCSVELSGLIEVYVQDFNQEGIPGMEIRVRWSNGEDTFFTGLKPERGPAYSDFQMDAGQSYVIEMPGRSDPSTQPLSAAPCTTEAGERAIISYRAVFIPAN